MVVDEEAVTTRQCAPHTGLAPIALRAFAYRHHPVKYYEASRTYLVHALTEHVLALKSSHFTVDIYDFSV